MLYYSKVICKLLQLVILSACWLSCNNTQFDKIKWTQKVDMEFPFRNKMLKNLTSNYKIIGLKYSQLIKLLGEPDFNDSCSLTYKIIEDYGFDIDPVYNKDIYFTFSKDSVISFFKINEWKK